MGGVDLRFHFKLVEYLLIVVFLFFPQEQTSAFSRILGGGL